MIYLVLSVFTSISSTTGSILTQLYNLSTNTGLITPNNISLVGSNPTYSVGSGGLIGYYNTVSSTLSTTATIGDSVVWSGTGNRLILQSGAGSAGLYLDPINIHRFNRSSLLDRMTISTNGNVGIGIGNAGALLHVFSNNNIK